MKHIQIGVSGDIGSFSEKAAKEYAISFGFQYTLHYLIDMNNVLSALNANDIELGIFPVYNNRGGLVTQAFEAMGKYPFTFVSSFPVEIEQCLMTRTDISLDEINQVASHPQGLAQCTQFIEKYFPRAVLLEAADTALAARDLAAGKYSDATAVIAPYTCVDAYGLRLLQKGIQDCKPNITTFIVVKR